MSTAFTVSELVKRYDDFTLGPLDLTLERGTVLGFIGPNGAGKTTTIHCLAGLIRPEAGRITIGDLSPAHYDPFWKQLVGFLGEERPFYEKWTGAQNLGFLETCYHVWDGILVDRLAERLDLDLERTVRDLSKGNRVKLGLVAALAHAPHLLLFDEPTEGLDPVVRIEALDVIREYLEADEVRAVFYATHVLSDISRLADELAFIRDGRLLMTARTDHLTDRWRQFFFQYDGVLPLLDECVEHRREGTEHRLYCSDYEAVLPRLSELGVEDLHVSHLGIDEIAVAILRNVGWGGEE